MSKERFLIHFDFLGSNTKIPFSMYVIQKTPCSKLVCYLFSTYYECFTDSMDLSIICFTERYKAGDHIVSYFFFKTLYFPQTKIIWCQFVCFEKALTILFVLFLHYWALSLLGSAGTSSKKCELLNFNVAKIVLFFQTIYGFMQSFEYKTRSSVWSPEYWFHCEKEIVFKFSCMFINPNNFFWFEL